MWVVPFSKNPMAHMVPNFNSIWMNYDCPHKFQKHFILQIDFKSSIFPQHHGNFVILNNNNNIHIFIHRTRNVQIFNKKNPYLVIKPLSIYWMDEIWISFWWLFLHKMVDENLKIIIIINLEILNKLRKKIKIEEMRRLGIDSFALLPFCP